MLHGSSSYLGPSDGRTQDPQHRHSSTAPHIHTRTDQPVSSHPTPYPAACIGLASPPSIGNARDSRAWCEQPRTQVEALTSSATRHLPCFLRPNWIPSLWKGQSAWSKPSASKPDCSCGGCSPCTSCSCFTAAACMAPADAGRPGCVVPEPVEVIKQQRGRCQGSGRDGPRRVVGRTLVFPGG